MSIPVAVSPGTLSPGLYLKVNLVAGAAAPSLGPLRVLLLCPKSSAGTLTPDTEIRPGGGEDSAADAFGLGTPGHLAAKQLYAAAPNALIDFGAPTAGAGAATRDIVFSGAPSQNTAVEVTIMGRTMQVGWLVGEDADDIRDKVIAAVNQRTSILSVVAASGGAGTVTITFKVTGNIGNDCLVRARLMNAQTDDEAVTLNTLTPLAGGTTDPDFSDILEAAQGREYHFIVACLSNADAVTTGSSSNAERALVFIEQFNQGNDAKLQQLIYASTTTLAAAEAAAVARNVGYAQHILCIAGQSLPCEFAAAEAGGRLAAIGVDPAANRIGARLGSGLFGAGNVTVDKPTPTEVESAIGNGVSIVSYDAAENLVVVRPVTTFSQNPQGGPDRRLLDTQNVDAAYIVARDLRTSLPAEFPNAKIQRDAPPGADPAPPGVIEERDIKAFVITRLRIFQNSGVILGSALDAAIADGNLIVRVNDFDPSQVDIVVPMQVIPPLAKFGVVVNRQPVT